MPVFRGNGCHPTILQHCEFWKAIFASLECTHVGNKACLWIVSVPLNRTFCLKCIRIRKFLINNSLHEPEWCFFDAVLQFCLTTNILYFIFLAPVKPIQNFDISLDVRSNAKIYKQKFIISIWNMTLMNWLSRSWSRDNESWLYPTETTEPLSCS